MITCQFENKSLAQLRHVTVNAIVVKDNRILLGKRGTLHGKPLLEAGKWGLLGGFLGRDETLIDAVKREVKEESGWEIDTIQLFRINDNPNRPKEDRQNVDIIFLAKAGKKISTPDEETKELQWFSLSSLPKPETIAFDHADSIFLYQKYIRNPFPLPAS